MSDTKWESVKEYEDILYDKFQGIARITINRPEVHNSFRPQTLDAVSYTHLTLPTKA